MPSDENAEPLTRDEVGVIRGALALKDKRVADAMTPLDNVYMVADDAVVDAALVRELARQGHSRVPVYHGERGQFVGILLLKALLEDPPTPGVVRRVRDMPLRPLVWADADCPLDEMLRAFRLGHTHMAAVRRVHKGGVVQVRGILTLADVMEQLLQATIRDETDADRERAAVTALEQPTAAESALLARNAPAQRMIDQAKAAAPDRPRRVPESEQFLLGAISDDDDDDDDGRPL
jgi:metal transporter CNNM